MTKWWCGDFELIFSRYLKTISLSKALKKQASCSKYLIVEFINTKQDNATHLPNALQISVLNPELVLKLVPNQQIIFLNNTEMVARQYYRFLTNHQYKVYWIKPRKEAKVHESF